MTKDKSVFTCSSCSYHSVKWLGCCPSCMEWNTFHEELVNAGRPAQTASQKTCTLTELSAVALTEQKRFCTGLDEWDRVLGGGIMPGSLLILTGDPGIGKSTLLLQISHSLAQTHTVFYFSTEESLQQVKLRTQRLACQATQLMFSDCPNLESIIATALAHKPDILIIDSIQNCISNSASAFPGSTNQLRETTFQLMRLAKENGIAILLSGHITKDGTIAGPKMLEHMVDGVFYLQGEDRWQTRILRSVKNRFGAINEIGFFEMGQHGLSQVCNINEHLLNEVTHAPGSVLISVLEGSRPLLLELQALTIESKMGIPQRVVSGIDHKQVVLIAAILEKYLHIKLSCQDIFFKVSGGFKVKDSSIDLGIALALLSSYFQQPLPAKSIVLGELNLAGCIQPINQINTFIREAEKFGIEQLLVAKNQKLDKTGCTVKRFANAYELLALFN